MIADVEIMGVVFINITRYLSTPLCRHLGAYMGRILPVIQGVPLAFKARKILSRVNVSPTCETLKRAYIGLDYGSSIHFTAPIEKFTKEWYNISNDYEQEAI